MPAGADFICNNVHCEHHEKTITILSPWPIGRIEKVIGSIKRKSDSAISVRDRLKDLEDKGEQFALIQFPNDETEIEQVGWRVQRWCQSCPRVGDDVILLADEDEDYATAADRSVLTENCPVCNDTVSDFDKVVEDGITCPYCKEKMTTETWFAKEVTVEYNGGKGPKAGEKNDTNAN